MDAVAVGAVTDGAISSGAGEGQPYSGLQRRLCCRGCGAERSPHSGALVDAASAGKTSIVGLAGG